MEINADYNPPAAETQATASREARPARLSEGTVIKGVITDIQQDQVSVLTESGETVTAKLSASIAATGAKIGGQHTFIVRMDENGAPTLELKPMTQAAAQKNVIADALASFGMQVTEHNIKVAALLLENQQPLTKELVQKLNQALKLMGPDITPESAAKAMFLINNGMSVNARAAQTLTDLAGGQAKLTGQLAALEEAVDAMPRSPLKDSLIAILTGGEAEAPAEAAASRIAQQSVAGPEAAVTRAFAENAPTEGFRQLGEALIEDFPEQRGLITRLVADKYAFADLIQDNKAALAQSIISAEEGGRLTPQTLARLIHSLIPNAAGETNVSPDTPGHHTASEPALPEGEPRPLTASQVKMLADTLFPEGGPAAEKLLEMLPRQQALALSAKYAIKPDSALPKNIDALLNTLRDNVEAAKELLGRNAPPEAAKAAGQLNKLSDNLEFIAQSKTNLFAQIPLAVPGGEANAELYVFRDKKRRGAASGAASALIALDTLNMGRFEVYVQKNGRQVDCQFRLRDEGVERLVRAHLPELETLLSQYAYRLQSSVFHRLGEAFTVLSREPSADAAPTARPAGLSFDVRT